MLTGFSTNTKIKIKYYVYRLIDPRNGETFYVGKGKGDRVFQHVRGAIEFTDDDYEDKASAKITRINEIIREGLDVIHVIQRYGLDEATAFEVEAALIDCFPGLTNMQGGYKSQERGVSNAESIEKKYSLSVYEEPDDIDYMIIKTTNAQIEICNGCLYDATRKSWRINRNRASKIKYVLSSVDGIVREVYTVDKWVDSDEIEGRSQFEGSPANENVRSIFVGHLIPGKYRKRGNASPVLYKDK